jgi:hypothetical protein
MSWFDYANLQAIVALAKSYKLKQFLQNFLLSKFFNSVAESSGKGVFKPQFFTFFPDPLVFSPTNFNSFFLRYCCDSCIMFSCRICTWQKTTVPKLAPPPQTNLFRRSCCFCLYIYVRSSFPNNLLHI